MHPSRNFIYAAHLMPLEGCGLCSFLLISNSLRDLSQAARHAVDGGSQTLSNTVDGSGDVGVQLLAKAGEAMASTSSALTAAPSIKPPLICRFSLVLANSLTALAAAATSEPANTNALGPCSTLSSSVGSSGLSQGDAHNGVLVHLHGCAGLANSATQSLDFLHGQTAGVDNPDSTGTLEIFLDRGEHRLILCVRHVLHLLLPQTRVPPHAGGVALEKKNDPCRPQTQGSLV